MLFNYKEEMIINNSTELKDLINKRIDEFRNDLMNIIDSQINQKSTKIKKKEKDKKTISKFCMEDYSYIQIKDIIKYSDSMDIVMCKIIQELYFNKNKKENNIVRISDDKYISILKHDTGDNNNVWKHYDMDMIIEKIIRRVNDVMQHYIIGVEEDEEKEFKDNIGEKKYEDLKEYTDMIDNLEDHIEFKSNIYELVVNSLKEYQGL